MDNNEFYKEILVKMKDIQDLQNIANAKHGMNDKDRHYVEKWDDLIKDTEKSLGESNG